MKIIALNLPRSFTEDELAKLFKNYGNIKGVDLVLDKEKGHSKGFGFVEMALEHEGKIAIKELHNSEIGKNRIRVKEAN